MVRNRSTIKRSALIAGLVVGSGVVASCSVGCRSVTPSPTAQEPSSGAAFSQANRSGWNAATSPDAAHDKSITRAAATDAKDANRVAQVDFETNPQKTPETASKSEASGTDASESLTDVGHRPDQLAELLSADFSIASLSDTTATQSAGDQSADDSSRDESQPGGPATLDDLEAIALASHPSISQARSQVEIARGRYTQSLLPPNPTLRYQSVEIGSGGASGLHSLGLSQRFVTANKLGLAGQSWANTIQQRISELRLAELQVLTEVRAAFARTLIAQQRVQVTKRLATLSEQLVTSTENLQSAEEVSRITVLQAQGDAAQAKVQAENAVTALNARRRGLSAAVGGGLTINHDLAGNVAADLVDTPWEPLLDEIVAASPELAAAGSDLQRARWALQLACAQVTPDITGQFGVGIDAASDDPFVNVGISVPLPIRNRNQGNIRAARAEMAAASQAIEQTRLDLQTRLARVVERYQLAQNRYQRLTETVLPNVEETFELSLSAFQAGETGFLQLLTAQRSLFSTQLTLLEAIEQARQAQAEIEGLLVTLS
jgi:cobalt-zinc-cadmium efflux system outer membrane protein